jgi:hypothetical protein
MRRVSIAVAALAVVTILSSCQDRQQPLAPSSFPVQFSDENAPVPVNSSVWIGGRTWTLQDGTTVCTDYDTESDFGVSCTTAAGVTTVQSWSGFAFNTDLYPVVEICLVTNGACDATIRNTFTRVLGNEGEIIVDKPQTGRYFLDMKPGSMAGTWLQAQPTGTYRVIVAITFTGLNGVTPIAGWNVASDKVLGWYDFDFNAKGKDDFIRFRIRDGALCEGGGEECIETAFTPEELEEKPIVLDENYELADDEGILGLKFPAGFGEAAQDILGQQKINVIVERVRLAAGERCISAGLFASSTTNPEGHAVGEELEPCYRITTEPYIDLSLLDGLTEPVRIGICLEPGAESFGSLLQMLKYSSVKNKITDIGDENLIDFAGSFFSCPEDYNPALALAEPTGTTRFALATSRLMGSVKSMVLPQPLHASFLTTRSPANGSLNDWSVFGVQAIEDFKAEFLSPIGTANASDPANLGPVRTTVSVRVCRTLSHPTGCPAATTGTTAWAGTATWGVDNYQVNWNTLRDQAEGTYRIELDLGPGVPVVTNDFINMRSSDNSAGTGKYTHNPGRTLPIKFYLTAP